MDPNDPETHKRDFQDVYKKIQSKFIIIVKSIPNKLL